MPRLPAIDSARNANESPHVVILGAGASLAAVPDGDRNGTRLPFMNSLVELVGLGPLLDTKSITYKGQNFEDLYDSISKSSVEPAFLRALERKIYEYFTRLKLPDWPTLYDYLLLTLRKKDLVATFNWDPFLAEAYRRNAHLQELPQIVFLHGNVTVGVCEVDRVKGYVGDKCAKCGREFSPTVLLYPVRDKSYTASPFISNEWEVLKLYLKSAYYLTIFGYSAPKTDAAARKLMEEVWNANETKELAEIDIVDIKSKNEIRDAWKAFFTRNHYGISKSIKETYLFKQPRRTCDAFAAATLMNRPWRNNPIPEFDSLTDLQRWIKPLISEEVNNKRFSGLPCSDLREA